MLTVPTTVLQVAPQPTHARQLLRRQHLTGPLKVDRGALDSKPANGRRCTQLGFAKLTRRGT
jgi:hypothetical protein